MTRLAQLKNHYRGSLLGLAVGDAMGAPVEMNLPGTFTSVKTMGGGGYFKLQPGEWTDDTALMLCSATSLVEKEKFDPQDHLTRFLRWWREGYMSTRPDSLGIGMVTAGALMRFESTGEAYCGPTGEKTAANGAIMHLAPVPLAYSKVPEKGIQLAADASRLTHGALDSVDACRFLAALIIGATRGFTKHELLVPYFDAVAPGIWRRRPLAKNLAELTAGAFHQKPVITTQNFATAVTTLHAALWGFYSSNTFEDGLLKVVNLGWDADTMGAVYGQLAGAFYGVEAIPMFWRKTVAKQKLITSLADELLVLAGYDQKDSD